jgi:tetratricopeptide (TPR) repeat protein
MMTLVFGLSSSDGKAAPPSAETLMTQALVLIQKGDKPAAFKLLQRAFEQASDPEMVKEIAVLVLEASPPHYPKRVDYLKYLTKHHQDHVDRWRWLKELGDKAFDAAQLAEAEDYYLQALRLSDDPDPIRFQLGWTYWNQKRRREALEIFIEQFEKSKEPSGLTTSLARDVARLWWETGVIPAASLDRIHALPSPYRDDVFAGLWSLFPEGDKPTTKHKSLLNQIRDHTSLQTDWEKFISLDVFFRSDPCFLVENVLRPIDKAETKTILSCLKEKAPHQLSPHLERWRSENYKADENLARAHATFFYENKREDEAVEALFEFAKNNATSSDYKKKLIETWAALSPDLFARHIQDVNLQVVESLVRESLPSKALLFKLQQLDPRKWVEFERSLNSDKQSDAGLNRDLTVKEVFLLAEKAPHEKERIEELKKTLLEQAQGASEKEINKAYEVINSTQTLKVAPEFGEKTMEEIHQWTSALDRSVAHFERLPEEWKKLYRDDFSQALVGSARTLQSQILALSLVDADPSLTQAFLKNKQDLHDQVEKRFRSYFAEGGRR